MSRVKGTFIHPNPFATFLVAVLMLALVLVFVAARRWRPPLVVVIVVSIALVLVTYTRVSWVAAVVGAGYLGSRFRRSILVWLLGGAVVVAIAVPSVFTRLSDLSQESGQANVPGNSLEWRFQYWSEILPLGQSSPVTGIGIGTTQLNTESGFVPHSVIVQVFVETGIVGVAALTAAIAGFAVTLRRRLRTARPGFERALALGAIAVALGILVQLPTENLLIETVSYWYFAAASTFGFVGFTSIERADESGFEMATSRA